MERGEGFAFFAAESADNLSGSIGVGSAAGKLGLSSAASSDRFVLSGRLPVLAGGGVLSQARLLLFAVLGLALAGLLGGRLLLCSGRIGLPGLIFAFAVLALRLGVALGLALGLCERLLKSGLGGGQGLCGGGRGGGRGRLAGGGGRCSRGLPGRSRCLSGRRVGGLGAGVGAGRVLR